MTYALDVTNPGDLLALTASTLGYTPSESLVIIGLQNGTTGLHLRTELTPAMNFPAWVAAEFVPIFAEEHEDCIILMFTSHAPTPEDSAAPAPRVILADALTEAMRKCGIGVAGAWQFGGGYARPMNCHDAECCPYPGLPAVLSSDTAEQLAPTTETTPNQTVEAFGHVDAEPQVAAGIAEADTSAEEGLQIWDAVMSADLSTDQLTTAGMAGLLAVLSDEPIGLITTAAADLATGYAEMSTTPGDGLTSPADTSGPAPDWERIDRLTAALAVVTPYADTTTAANAYAVMGWVSYIKGQSTHSNLFCNRAERADSGNELARAVRTVSVSPSAWAKSKATAYKSQ